MGKIISVFSHKGGVGKTTFVYNLSHELTSRGKSVLLIDTDPQVNLTALLLGKAESFSYEPLKKGKDRYMLEKDIHDKIEEFLEGWAFHFEAYRTFGDHIEDYVKNLTDNDPEFKKKQKPIYKSKFRDLDFGPDLLSGHINTAIVEHDWHKIIEQKTQDPRPITFERSIRDLAKEYDFVIIDTPPSSTSVLNAICVSCCDYFLSTVTPNFFSLQSVGNLTNIVQYWSHMLAYYKSEYGKSGLSVKSKFLGIVINRAKIYNRSGVKTGNNQYTIMAKYWSNIINAKLSDFTSYMYEVKRDFKDFSKVFKNSEPYIIESTAQFPNRIESLCENQGIPILMANQVTEDINKYNDTCDSISLSYKNIADGLIRLLDN